MRKIAFHILLLFLFSGKIIAQASNPIFDKAYTFYQSKKFREALALLETPNQISSAEALIIKGFVYTDSISFDKGKKYFEEAETLLENTAEAKLKCKNYFGLGKGYFFKDDFNKSISYFLQSELEASKGKYTKDQCAANYYLAKNFQRLKNIPASNTYIKKAIGMAKTIKDSSEVFRGSYQYASNYQFYLSADSSTFVYFDSIMMVTNDAKKYINDNNYIQMAQLHDLYSKAYAAKDDYKKRKEHALTSLRYYLKTQDTINMTGACISTSQAYLELEQFDSALYYQQMPAKLNIPDSTFGSQVLRIYYFNYYKIYISLNNKEKALYYLEEFVYHEMDVNYEEDMKNMQLREDFESQKTKQHIADEKEKDKALYQQKTKFYLYISSTALLLLILLAYFFYYRLKTKKEKEQKDLQLLIQNAELTALKAQMNPHFIFNALNSIQHSIVKNNTEEAYRFLSKFSKLIRNILDSSSEQLVPLKSEIEMLSLYVEIESKRFDHSFHFDIKLEENKLSGTDLLIPPMILQPFIENAIWHGLMPKEGEKNLIILFSIPNENTVICKISDNGIGREKAKQIALEKGKTHKSKGISNIMERVNLLKITLSINIEIEILDDKNADGTVKGTSVIVKFIKSKN